jgi:hypothetical protein
MGGRMILTTIMVALHSAFWKIPWALAGFDVSLRSLQRDWIMYVGSPNLMLLCCASVWTKDVVFYQILTHVEMHLENSAQA